jgi:plastocyanin
MVMVTGLLPQSNRMIPPRATAATTALEVQLAGVPVPTIRLALRVSTARASAGTAAVTVSNLKFEPRTLQVKAGTTVTWQNKEGVHTVKADNGAFESDTLSAGASFSHKFDKPGRYPYHCDFHGSAGGHDMAGVIVVTK